MSCQIHVAYDSVPVVEAEFIDVQEVVVELFRIQRLHTSIFTLFSQELTTENIRHLRHSRNSSSTSDMNVAMGGMAIVRSIESEEKGIWAAFGLWKVVSSQVLNCEGFCRLILSTSFFKSYYLT